MARKVKVVPAPKAVPQPPVPMVKRVPLLIQAEGAREVVLTGEFTQWSPDKIRLTPAFDGAWTTVLELAPGEYQYRLIVDGQWRDHPEAARRVPNPFGTENCVLTVA